MAGSLSTDDHQPAEVLRKSPCIHWLPYLPYPALPYLTLPYSLLMVGDGG